MTDRRFRKRLEVIIVVNIAYERLQTTLTCHWIDDFKYHV